VLAVIGLAILSRNDSGVGPAPGSRPASQPEPVDGRNAAPALAPSRSDEKRKLLAYSDCSKKFEGKLRESLDGFFDCLQEQGIPEPRRGDVRYRAELVAHEECLEQTQKQERILAYDDCMIARGFPEAVPSRDPKYRQEMERIDAESAAMEECYQQTGFRGPLVLPSQLPLAQALANCMADAGHPSLKEDFDRLADDPEARARFFALLQAMEDYKFCSRDVGGDTQAMKACMDSLGSRWARRTGQ
jgi:hypothetical protein